MRTTNASMRLPEEVFARINGGVNARLLVQGSPVGVIVCHPWGPLGGSMHDPVVRTACKLFADGGCTTARFDFRSGIGCGVSSADDVCAVARHLLEGLPAGRRCERVLLVGYSYGSMVCLAACAELGAGRCVGVAALAPPLDYGWALFLFRGRAVARACARFPGPKLFVVGDRDQFCALASLDALVTEVGPAGVTHVELRGEGADHFGIVRHVTPVLERWVREAFGVGSVAEFGRLTAWPGDDARPAAAGRELAAEQPGRSS